MEFDAVGLRRKKRSRPHKKLSKKVIKDNCEYSVWYGTNRRLLDSDKPGKGYSTERDTKIHLGRCTVFIPKSHKIGSVGSVWWKRLMKLTDDRIKLRTIEEIRAQLFWNQVSAHLKSVANSDRHAVIFIHGYNVSFRDAAIRAAQIRFDLSIKGAMAFFSWPSKATIRGYAADEATIEASERCISAFMTDFAKKSGARAVHIIAHSMGNRGVLRAVNRIAKAAQMRSKIPFAQIVLAAADVDIDTFHDLSSAYKKVARRTTLYVSTRDHAVEASRWLHSFARAGLAPPICIQPGIDTVNVENSDLSLLGHGYIAETRDVLNDIHQLFNSNTAPNKRFGLREKRDENGKRYWVIGA
jgi:esterase/lipase superfamily enzyme